MTAIIDESKRAQWIEQGRLHLEENPHENSYWVYSGDSVILVERCFDGALRIMDLQVRSVSFSLKS